MKFTQKKLTEHRCPDVICSSTNKKSHLYYPKVKNKK